MNTEYEENTISLAEIWDKLWKHKYLILIITAAIGIILSIGLYFGLQGQQLTVTNFEYDFVNVEVNKFADGSTFEFRDLISYDKLEEIKASDSKYSDIDVEAIYESDGTTIERRLSPYSTVDDIIYTDNQFILSIPYQYFDYDEDLARAFIDDLLSSVIDEALVKDQELAIYNYVDLVDDNVEYLDAIDYYLQQYNLLLNSMNSFISNNGDVTYNNINITDMRERLVSAYNNTYTYDEITTLIKNEAYYKNIDSFIEKLNLRISNIQRSIDLNVDRINELETMYQTLVANSNLQQADVLLTRIADYRIANVNYQFQIEEYQDIINQANARSVSTFATNDFIQIIDDVETFLNDNTDAFNDFYVSFSDHNTELIYQTGSIFEVEGGYSPILLVLVSGFIGFVASLVVVFIKESQYALDKK